MSLNIKNEHTHQLVRELSQLTGTTQTEAVTMAVQDLLERLRHTPSANLADRLLAIGRDIAPRLIEPYRSMNHGDLLYGENGLPL